MIAIFITVVLQLELSLRNAAAKFALYAFILTVAPAVGAMNELERRRRTLTPIVILIEDTERRSKGLQRAGVDSCACWVYNDTWVSPSSNQLLPMYEGIL